MYRKLLGILICLILISLLSPTAHAGQTSGGQPLAITVTGEGYGDLRFLTDENTDNYKASDSQCTLTLTDNLGSIGSLYLMFDLPCEEYTVTDNINGTAYTAGSDGFLHEYIKLDKPTGSVTIQFYEEVSLSEIQAFSYGADPQGIQIWQPPLEGDADLMLMSTHGDDEHLFFGGILPMYAGQLGYQVQVVYLTDHRNLTNRRTHEMLNGLWAVGICNYPVFGSFADFRNDSMEKTYEIYAEKGTTREDILDYVVTQIRRFKPQVIVGHDFEGEYGHGMHKVYADVLAEAVTLTTDEKSFPESAESYGTWDVPKTYIHLYTENPIVVDFDTPLSRFDGISAFDVSRYIGFPCHKSQLSSTTFGNWVYGYNREITSVWEIAEYNPCYYGLFRSTVGPDILKNDFMENTQNSLVRKQQEEERLAKEEAERLATHQATQETDQNAEEVFAPQSPAQQAPSETISIAFIFLGAIGLISLPLLIRLRKKM